MAESRIHGSCDECLTSKVKCSKDRLICQRCLHLGRQCVYSRFRRMGRPRHKHPVPNDRQAAQHSGKHDHGPTHLPPLLSRSDFHEPPADRISSAVNASPLALTWLEGAQGGLWSAGGGGGGGGGSPPDMPEQTLAAEFTALTAGLAPYPSMHAFPVDPFLGLQDVHVMSGAYHESGITASPWQNDGSPLATSSSMSTSQHAETPTADTLRSSQCVAGLFSSLPSDLASPENSTQHQRNQSSYGAEPSHLFQPSTSCPSDRERAHLVHGPNNSAISAIPDTPRCVQQCLGALNEQLETIVQRQADVAGMRLDDLLSLHHNVSGEHQKTLSCAFCMAAPRRGRTIMMLLMVVSKLHCLVESAQSLSSNTCVWRHLSAETDLSVAGTPLDATLKAVCCRKLLQLYVLRLLKFVKQLNAGLIPGNDSDVGFRLARELLVDTEHRAQGLFGLTVLDCELT